MFQKKTKSFKNLPQAFTSEQLTDNDLDILTFAFSNNNFEITINTFPNLEVLKRIIRFYK